MPRPKPLSERYYVNFDRDLKRLWENTNAIAGICGTFATHPNRNMGHTFLHIRADSERIYSAHELRDSARDVREGHAWDWCLIVAFALVDAWLLDEINHLHSRFPDMLAKAKSCRYNFDAPSFSTRFFKNDLAGIGLAFPVGDTLVSEFVKWKEARNCLVHQGGCISQRYATLCNPAPRVGKPLKITNEDARMACRAIFNLADSVQKQIRRVFRTRHVRP